MVELASNVLPLVENLVTFVPNLSRQLLQWADARDENPLLFSRLERDITQFETDFDRVARQLSTQPSSSSLAVGSTHHTVRNLRTRLKDLRQDISTLDVSKKRYELHPRELQEKIGSLRSNLEQIQTSVSELRSDLLSSLSLQTPKLDVPEEFVVVRNVDRSSTGVNVMDFHTEDEDGCPLTYEAQLKDAIFTQTTSSAVGAVAQGPGGVGKSCALRAIALLKETDERFPGGTLYISVGAQASLLEFIEKIAEIVEKAGGKPRAEIIREKRDFLHATQVAGDWFQAWPCLFLIDDVWLDNGITKTSVGQLANLVKNPESAIALTARDKYVNLGKIVRFEEREQLGHKAKDILLKNANLSSPSSLDADLAFNRILHLCGGLPIMLSGFGATIGYIARERCFDDPERAWGYFLSEHWEMAEHAVDEEDSQLYLMRTTLIALDLINGSRLRMNFKEMFVALCVLRNQQYMPVHVAQGLWNISRKEARKFVDSLERFAIARLRVSDRGKTEIGLHDVYLQIAQELAEENGTRREHSQALLCSYARELGEDNPIESRFREWWMRVEDDGYIYDNVCRQLMLAGLYDELLWLMTNPEWVIARLKSYKNWQVDEDVRQAMDSLTSNERLESTQKREAKEFLNVLCQAVHLSAKHVQETDWSGTPWFQLCGRMVHLGHENMFVKRFIGSVRERAPRPWLNPSVGCLPTAGDSLRHEIDIEGDILCHGEDVSTLYFFYLVSVGGKESVSLKRYNLNSRTEAEPEVVLEINNGLFDFDVLERPVAFCSSCAVLCVGLRTGEIVLVNLNKRRSIDDSGIVETPRHVAADNDKARCSFRSWCCFSNQADEGREDLPAATSPDVTSTYDTEVLNGYGKEINSIALSCNAGELIIVTGYGDGMVIFWGKDATGWRLKKLKGHTDVVLCVAMNADGSRAVSGSYDRTVRVWETGEGEWRGVELKGHTDGVRTVAMNVDGSRVVSGSEDRAVRVWEMGGGEWRGVELKGHRDMVLCVAMNADGSRVVSGSEDRAVRVWEMGGSEWRGVELNGHTEWVHTVAMNADGSRAVSGSLDKTVRVWEMGGGEWRGVELKGHTGMVRTVAMNADGSRVVSGSDDETLRVWKMAGGEWRGVELKGHTDGVLTVAMNADGSRAVSGSLDRTVRVWEMGGGEWRGVELKGHTDRVVTVAMNVDVSRAVSGSFGRTVRVWEMAGGEWRGVELKGHSGAVLCVGVNADGSRAVSGSEDRAVRVWEMAGGEWRGVELEGHTGWVLSVAMNADGSRVVSGSYDETVRVWGMDGGEWRGVELEGHTGFVCEVKIAADGYRVGCRTYDSNDRDRFWTWSWVDGEWSSAVENAVQEYMSSNWMGSTQRRWTGVLDYRVIHQVVEPLGGVYTTAYGFFIHLMRYPFTAHIDILK